VLQSGTVITWWLDKVTDRAGNTMRIIYTGSDPKLKGITQPATIDWTPSAQGSTNYNYEIAFTYSTTATTIPSQSGYVAGNAYLDQIKLTNIEVVTPSSEIKNYVLTYNTSATTGRPTLTSVQECADHAATDCLLATGITYQAGQAGTAATPTPALTSSSGANAQYDFNGDGRSDIGYANGGIWYVAMSTGTGYATPVSTGVTALAFGDVLGKGSTGIIANHGGTLWYYTYNGTTFTGQTTGVSFDSTVIQYLLVDLDGNGHPALVALYSSSITARANTSSGSTPSFASTPTTIASVPLTNSGAVLIANSGAQSGSLTKLDFNGDGRQDLVLQTDQNVTVGQMDHDTYTNYELLSNGSSSTMTSVMLPSGQDASNILFLNWNDDNCTDAVFNKVIYISGCNATNPTTFVLASPAVAALDWDGDGRTDVLVANGNYFGVYLSTGNGIGSTMLTTSVPYSSTGQYFQFDVQGDGLDDLGYRSATSPYAITYYSHNGAGQPPDLLSLVKDGYGNSATPTYVSIAQNNYSNYTDATSGYENYIGPLYVVNQTVFSDPSQPPNTTYNQTFYYYGAWMNIQGRGFQSFYAKRMIDSRNGLYYFNYYERAFPFTGMDFEDVLSNSAGAHIMVSVRTPTTLAASTLDPTVNNQRYFPYFTTIVDTQQELGGIEDSKVITSATTNLAYDGYGNLVTATKIVTDSDPGPLTNVNPYAGNTWTTSVTNTTDISANQAADTAKWCLNLIDTTVVTYTSTAAGSTPVTRTKNFTPDTDTQNACRIKTIVTEPNSSLYKVTEALTFDNFGNVFTDTVTGVNMTPRVTTLNWGTTGQFLTTITDPSNATTTATYTSPHSLGFGVPDSVKDPNNLTTLWQYDGFGRKSQETRPDGTSTTWAWSACTSFCGWSNSVYQIVQTAFQTNGTTVIRIDTNSYDPVDRVTQRVAPTVSVTGTATVQNLYNSVGLLVKQSLPFLNGGTAYQQSYNYDPLNRVIEIERPNKMGGPTWCDPTVAPGTGCQGTSFTYFGRRRTVTDAKGHAQTTLTDVNGWLRQTTDALGYMVTTSYDSAGSVNGITDSVGNSLLKNVTYAYGIKPFLTAATDADRGAWSYTVDALGERTGWKDANNINANSNPFVMTYDALSRPKTRTDPDQFTQWTWGSTPANHDVGQLTNECTGTAGACSTSAGYSETRTFDSLGRLWTRSISEGNNPGNDGGAFLFTNGYDSTTGLLSTLTYPTSTSAFGLPTIFQTPRLGAMMTLEVSDGKACIYN
jgi:YD repeat-containing protein